MRTRTANRPSRTLALAAAALICGAALGTTAEAHNSNHGPKDSVGTLYIKEQGVFFVGGHYNDDVSPTFMSGQMYVRYQIPVDPDKGKIKKYPVVMVHGGAQQSTTFTGTPDDRSGWADYFLKKGWPVYIVDQPGRGRSPYIESVYGPRNNITPERVEQAFTALAANGTWPQAQLHTQWPGTGMHGDTVFDQFFASQWGGMDQLSQEEQSTPAIVALLDKIGPAVLLTHSQSGPFGWQVADRRPQLVKAILAAEPNGPPFMDTADTFLRLPWGIGRLPMTYDPPVTDPAQLNPVQESQPQAPDLLRCWRQSEPAHKLVNLPGIPILILSSEASQRGAQYDHCTSQYLTQAGVPNERVRLQDVGIHGNGHMMMLEKNNLEIAAFMETWLRKKLTEPKHNHHHKKRGRRH